MACATNVWIVVIINGYPTDFFLSRRGLRQGCYLSPLLFILVMDGFSRKLSSTRDLGTFQGLRMTPHITVTHLLFVDDILTFGMILRDQWATLHHIFQRYGQASSLFLNGMKSYLYFSNSNPTHITHIADKFCVGTRL